MIRDIWQGIEANCILPNKKNYIWGTGTDSLSVFVMALQASIYIDGFIDSGTCSVKQILYKKVYDINDVGEGFNLLYPESLQKKVIKLKKFNANYIKVPIYRLVSEIMNTRKLVVYGAGDNGRSTYNKLKELGIRVDWFADSCKEKVGTDICNIKVLGINEIPLESTIIISSLWYKDIAIKLNEEGFTTVFVDYNTINNVEYPSVIISSDDNNTRDVVWGLVPQLFHLQMLGDWYREIVFTKQNGYGRNLQNVFSLMDIESSFGQFDSYTPMKKYRKLALITDIKEDEKRRFYEVSSKKLTNLGYQEGIDFRNAIAFTYLITPYNEKRTLGGCPDPLLGFTINYERTSRKYSQYVVWGNPQKCRIKVMILGNSVSDVAIANIKIWPRVLRTLLGEETCFFCGAIGAYNVRQECLKLLRDIDAIKPDIVISVSGINETVGMPISGHPFYHFFHKSAFEGLNRPVDYGMQNVEKSGNLWIRMQCTMRDIANNYGASYIGCFQPTIFDKKYLIGGEENIRLFLYDSYEKNGGLRMVEKKYREVLKIVEECVGNKGIYNLAHIFDERCEEVFYDHVHLNEYGNELLGQKIYQLLEQELGGFLEEENYKMESDFIKEKSVLIYGIGKVQQDFQYMFSDMDVRGYIEDSLGAPAVWLEKQVYKLKEILQIDFMRKIFIIVCDYDYNQLGKNLQSAGYVYKKDFAYAHDFFSELDYPLEEKIAGRKLAVWGTGYQAKKLMADEFYQQNTIVFIDNDKQKEGSFFEGRKILHPNSILDWSQYYIIIAVEKYYYEIRQQLFEKKLNEYTDFVWGELLALKPSEMLLKTIYDKARYDIICETMFNTYEIEATGAACCCCTTFVKERLGNLIYQTFEEIWYSNIHKVLCLSVANHTYTFCSKDMCPVLQLRKKMEHIKNFEEKHYKKFGEMPKVILLSIDSTCNLYCASCRDEICVLKGNELEKAQIMADKILKDNNLPNAEFLVMAGNGEVFLSKIYERIWSSDKTKNIPRFRLLSNGTLFNEKRWNEFYQGRKNKIAVTFSIDAATKDTYSIVRRGGNFDALKRNMEFASRLRKEGKLSYFQISFVVQRMNYKEMPAFVEWGKALGVDKVFFTRILNWGTYTEEEFKNIAMTDADGNMNAELQEISELPIMQDKIVDFGTINFRPNNMNSSYIYNYYIWEIERYL